MMMMKKRSLVGWKLWVGTCMAFAPTSFIQFSYLSCSHSSSPRPCHLHHSLCKVGTWAPGAWFVGRRNQNCEFPIFFFFINYSIWIHRYIFNRRVGLRCLLRNNFVSIKSIFVRFLTNFIGCRANKANFLSFTYHFYIWR